MLLTNYVCDTTTNAPNWYYQYINTGIQMPALTTNGNVCLLVESGVSSALAAELTTLTNDLVTSGYKVYRHDVAADDVGSGTWSNGVYSVKALVVSDFNSDSNVNWTVLIVGHVPVPYSGDSSPGGHTDNLGAHPADWYYTDLGEANWTDSTVNDSSADLAPQWNVPSDGKFDQSTVPAIPAMRIGRVDIRNLTPFSKTETELLQQYLNRNHSWRVGGISVRSIGLINSNNNAGLIYRGKPFEEHSIYSSFWGTTNNTILGTWLGDGASTNGFLMAASYGNGLYAKDFQIGTTTNFAQTNLYVPFVRMYGSYYGDWDSGVITNAILQAPLASGGYTLTVYYHAGPLNMDSPSMGLPISQKLMDAAANYSVTSTKRYRPSAYYIGTNLTTTPQTLNNYQTLLGDPTLGLYAVLPPTNVTARANGANAVIYWDASPDTNVSGYYVYRAPNTNRNSFTLLNASPTSAPFTDSGGMAANNIWWVRAAKLEDSANRSFYALSQGALQSGVIYTNYYIATNGNNSNAGSSDAPFLTVSNGLRVARAGDTIVVGPGTYDEALQSQRNGSNGAPIVVDGGGVATIKSILLRHPYHYIQNLTFTGVTNAAGQEIYCDRGAHYCVISNNFIDLANAPGVYGIHWNAPATMPFGTGDAASHVTVISNIIQHSGGYVMISMFGDSNLVYGNLLKDSPQADCFNVFGRDNRIACNVCSNFPYSADFGNHSDFIQTFSNGGQGCSNLLVEGNICIGVTNGGTTLIAIGQLSSNVTTNTTDWTIRNNLFINFGAQLSCSIPNVRCYNNTLINCSDGAGFSWSSNFFNGTGYLGATGADLANGGQCFNNLFFQCGDGRPLTGWYYFSSELTNVAADYNFVCNTNYAAFNTNTLHQTIGDPTGWNNFQWWEDHGINGGNPSFVNEAAGNFRLLTNSFLIGVGTNLTAFFTTDLDGVTRPAVGGWTIGAYEGGTNAPSIFTIDRLGTANMGKSNL